MNANEWTFNFCTFALIVCECFNYNSMQNIAEKRTQTEKNVLCPSVNSPMQLKGNSTEWEKKTNESNGNEDIVSDEKALVWKWNPPALCVSLRSL